MERWLLIWKQSLAQWHRKYLSENKELAFTRTARLLGPMLPLLLDTLIEHLPQMGFILMLRDM
jgi:hypothetical protein